MRDDAYGAAKGKASFFADKNLVDKSTFYTLFYQQVVVLPVGISSNLNSGAEQEPDLGKGSPCRVLTSGNHFFRPIELKKVDPCQ